MDNNISQETNKEQPFDDAAVNYPEALNELAGQKTRLTYLKGETLFKQGAFAPFVLYVVKGLVKITFKPDTTNN